MIIFRGAILVINVWQSHPIDVVSEIGELVLETLSLSDAQDQILSLGVGEGQTLDGLPMVEDALGEGLSLGVSSKHAGETEGFRDGQEGFNLS